ncbi:MAG: PEP-CTERM sorting domain-containing protein [Phycisphaera sp.]|nr:PEP-CTERM sorting domain-containing protein [Phycisphaera sp.]
MKKGIVKRIALCGTMAAAGATPALAQVTGPSTSTAPYVLPAAPGVTTMSILTVGDSVNLKPNNIDPYVMVGVPDGLGAYDNGNGTFTLLMNHELGNTDGITRAHGDKGAFVSRWVIDSNTLTVNNGKDLNDTYVTSTVGAGTLTTFNRLCSADLAPVTAFYNASSGNGSQNRIFLNGEESSPTFSGYGRGLANVVDASGAGTGTVYELPAFNGVAAWENLLAHPNNGNVLGDKTVVIGNSDGGSGDRGVYMYVGTKTNTGTEADKAGLTNGSLYGVVVGTPGGTESQGSPISGSFSLSTNNADTTDFRRPEDGAWDPSNPNRYYFVTTDGYDQDKDGVGATTARSRLYAMDFTDITNPTAGGTITALLDGTEGSGGGFGPNMMDNICTVKGADGVTRILIQEDVGNNAHNGKVWLYDTATDQLTLVLQHDVSLFGDLSTVGSLTKDEEASGIIDARDVLGLGWFLLVDQAHYSTGVTETKEGGQLIAAYIPQAIPEPTSLVALALGGMMILGNRRRRA